MYKIMLCAALGFLSLLPHNMQAESQRSDQTTKVIQLYIYPECPYCKKVIAFLKQNNWQDRVMLLDANKPEHYKTLLNISGDTVCPYLVDQIHEISMPESTDIIKHFQKIFKNS